MKKNYLLVLIAIFTLLMAGCGGPQTGDSQQLNLYGWSEYVPQALLEKFTQETGIRVNYDTYSSNEELLAKLQAGAAGYDLIIPSDYTVSILTAQGLLEEIDISQIPNFSNIDPQFQNPYFDPENKYTIPYQWGTTGLVVDTEKVTEPITKWSQLWDPAFEDRVVMLDDGREVLGIVLQMLGFDRNSTNPDELAQAKDKLLELMPNIRLFDSDSPHSALLTGEAWLGLTWNGEATKAYQENPSIAYICPEEGCGIWVDTLAIPKGAPHKDAAIKFMNFVLDPANNLMITKEFPYSSANLKSLELFATQDPAAYAAYMAFPGTNPPPDWLLRASPVLDIGEATMLWDQIWTEVKGGE
jgi:spermidine/putrescine-binding protein